jgi:hypothetical protein
MNQPRIIDLSDEAFAIIEREALRVGKQPGEWLAEILRPYNSGHSGSSQAENEREAAKLRFESHFGELDDPEAVGLDNDQIDTDIARGYSDFHEAG